MSEREGEILTPEQVAELIQASPRTIEEWRRTRTGPRWCRMGRHVRYLRREVLVWFEELGWTPMVRQKLRAGELGAIQVMELPSGRFQAAV